MNRSSTTRVSLTAQTAGQCRRRRDVVATEEPMEIRVEAGSRVYPVSITMRTPGHDFELAAGFLWSEGVIRSRKAIERISYCTSGQQPQHYNIVTVHLRANVPFDPLRLSRYVYMSSSCGICGKASLEQVRAVNPPPLNGKPQLPDGYFMKLPEAMRRHQATFARTGGLHAAALFDAAGNLVALCEDVGRHNALDKLVGTLLLSDRLPAHDAVVLVSGRASFELVQKALLAGIPILAALSAPSSLAIDLAREFGMTLVGFLRDGGYNIYVGE
jgi:FdhD protein